MLIFFLNSEKTLSADLQFAPDGCARASLVTIWVALQLLSFLSHKVFTNYKSAYAYIHSLEKLEIKSIYKYNHGFDIYQIKKNNFFSLFLILPIDLFLTLI